MTFSDETISDLSTTINNPNTTLSPVEQEHFCKLILYLEVANSRVRIWDIIILVPNVLFMLFLAIRFNRARLKLRATNSPNFMTVYCLVIGNVLISVIRCVVSMTVSAATPFGSTADKILWVTVRFFLLATEMSVVIFGLACGHLDSRSSIRHVLIGTSLISLVYTITQGVLEIVLPDDSFHIHSKDFDLYGHGGMLFWFCSSLIFTCVYLLIFILPWTRLRERLQLPRKRSFYVYIFLLMLLDLVQSIGAGLLNYGFDEGLCVVDVTTGMYFTLLAPLVYHTFLSEFLGTPENGSIQPLRPEHSIPLNSIWPHKFYNSDIYLANMISKNGGYGIFIDDLKPLLVSWVTKNDFGAVAILQTLEEYKRKGYAALLIKILAKKEAEKNLDSITYIVRKNIVSQTLFKGLGFVKNNDVRWVQFKPLENRQIKSKL